MRLGTKCPGTACVRSCDPHQPSAFAVGWGTPLHAVAQAQPKVAGSLWVHQDDLGELSRNAGGLTLNDFILAAKINDIDFADLMPKKKAKFWA